MQLYRVLQISLALLATIGGLTLGVGQRSAALTVITLVSAAGGFYFTDLRQRIHVGGWLANGYALIVAGVAAVQYSRLQGGQELLAVANLLTYLQIVPLFQFKSIRVAWQLFSLSFLQLVVASALSDSVGFGLLVLAYFLVAVVALAALFLLRETLLHARVAPRQNALLADGRTLQRALHDRVRSGRWPWSTRRRRRRQPALVRGEWTDWGPGPSQRRVIARWSWRLAAVSVAIAAALFIVTPRRLRSMNEPGGDRTISVTGFNDQVELADESRSIMQDDTIVMRVRFLDDATGATLRPRIPAWLRGTVNEIYEGRHWRRQKKDPQGYVSPPLHGALVRQELLVERTNSEVVCHVAPAQPTDEADERALSFSAHRIARRDHRRARSTETYTLLTSGFHAGEPHPLLPAGKGERRDLLAPPPKDAVAESEPWRTVRAEARRVLAEAEATEKSPHDRAIVLRDYLLSGKFQYTLARPAPTQNVDPLVDFLTTNRAGHCEFFATALALMLRTEGIPARLAVGYRSGEWNPIGGYYQVRQLHAHSWVEMYLTKQEIPESLRRPGESYEHGGWLLLDPTPADDDAIYIASGGGLWSTMSRFVDHVDLMWRNHIVGYNQQRQQKLLLEPLAADLESLIARWWGESSAWAEALQTPVDDFGGEAVFGWRQWLALGATAAVGVVAVAGVVLLVAGPVWWWRKRARRDSQRRSVQMSPSAAYRQFEKLLARHGHERQPHQTPLEFAAAVAEHFAHRPNADELAARSTAIVRAYYRLRFGPGTTSPADELQLTAEVASLRQTFAARS